VFSSIRMPAPSSTDVLDTIGPLSVDDFMRRHWQRAPLLARGAFPGFASPIEPAALFGLAARDDVEARLVARDGGRWTLRHGPFERLPSRRRPDWTLLVQGTDLHDDAMHALMSRFRFVPDARVDDLMVSFATDGGGVGPHVDQYDVFLLQARGTRRWRIAPPGDPTLVPGVPLKLLARFEPTEEWVLEPGDMLYLPPGWGHDGVAVGECMTFSIGFRAPSRLEFLSAFLAAAADAPGGPDPRFGDRGRRAGAHPGALPDDLARRLHDWAVGWRPSVAEVERFVGCWLTEPKATVWFEGPERGLDPARFARAAARDGLRLDRRSRMAWRGAGVFANGEAVEAPAPARRWLRRLADRRALTAAECSRALADDGLAAILQGWYDAGWLRLDETPAPR
jgi:50S ribosomal protein L16 3-hydroxylase